MPEQSQDNPLQVYPNGIDGSTGGYALQPLFIEQLADYIQKIPTDRDEARVIEALTQYYRKRQIHGFELPSGVDAQDLAQAGWGVIFPPSIDFRLLDILKPMLDWRQNQAGPLFKVFQGPEAYVAGENPLGFLERHGVKPGPLHPDQVPYYLLLIGGPEHIPFAFQSQLSRLGYAVGRLAFEDPFHYAQYASSLMQMESGDYLMPRTAAFFDAALENDPGMLLSSQQMIHPLMKEFEGRLADQDWKTQYAFRDRATKSNLQDLLGGGRTPAFLFINAEGMQFPAWQTDYRYKQGALLCYDWPGPGSGITPNSEQFFGATDILDDARLIGLVAFFYASFSLGTPVMDEIERIAMGGSGPSASFVAALPQRMLLHPAGSALGVVGMSGRAWGYSFDHVHSPTQTEAISRVLQRLANGERLGSALSEISTRAAAYSTIFEEKLQDYKLQSGDPLDLVGVWVAWQDALSLSLLGDPAVRLYLAQPRPAPFEASFEVQSGATPPEGEAAPQVLEGEGPPPTEQAVAPEEVEITRPVMQLSEEERQRVQRILAIVQPLSNDMPAEQDLLGITDEVNALADALILREIRPPMAVGILGGWGSGKSTVMNLIDKRIAGRRTERVTRGWSDKDGQPSSAFVGHIYQIGFNAWTYAKSNLWASLMQTIFFELNRQMSRERELAEKQAEKDLDRMVKEPGPTGEGQAQERPPVKWELLDKESKEGLVREALMKGGEAYADIYKLHIAGKLDPLWEGLRQRKEQEVKALQVTEQTIAMMKAQRENLLLKRQQEALQRLERQAQLQAIEMLIDTTRRVIGTGGKSSDVKGALEKLDLEQQQLKASLPPAGGEESIPQTGGEVAGGKGAGEGTPAAHGQAQSQAAGETARADAAVKEGAQPPPPEAQVIELAASLHGVGMTLIRLQYGFSTTSGWGKAVILLLAVIGLLAIFLPFLVPVNLPIFKDTLARLTALTTMVLPWARIAANWSKQVNQLLGDYEEKVETERKNLISRLGEEVSRRQSLDAEKMQQALVKAGADTKKQQDALTDLVKDGNLAALEEQLRRAELKAEEQRRQAGPAGQYVSLLEFVRSRLDEEVYEKELGLMHRIKRDIDELTDGLTIREQDIDPIKEAKRKLFPRGEARILLYIDDLDRCPPPRVVDVLEAVQLLINTELFIVVLGLDTRYITRALEKEYKEILQHSGDPSGLDYIEKIIQLPYRVRPIKPERLDEFIDDLTKEAPAPTRSEQASQPEGGAAPAPGGDGRAPAAGTPPQATGPAPAPAAVVGESPPPEGTAPSLTPPTAPDEAGLPVIEGQPDQSPPPASAGAGSPSPAAETPPEDARATEGPTPLKMEMIRLTDEDKAELERCLGQISLTPRGVKRLVNVIKLLKVFWVNTQNGDPPLEIKRCMIGLLSLSAAYPEAMVEAFARLDMRYRSKENLSENVGDFLITIERTFLSDRSHEAINWQLDNFRKNVTALMALKKDQAFFKIRLADLEEERFNLVRSFSFVGDPVYAFDGQSTERQQPGVQSASTQASKKQADTKPVGQK